MEAVRQGGVDLAIIDMNYSRTTSGVEGLSLLRRLRLHLPDLPVMLITGWGSIELAVEGMRAGAYDFITKPVEQQGASPTRGDGSESSPGCRGDGFRFRPDLWF